MADYIVQADGTSKILLEDGTGAILQEEAVAPTFISSVTQVYAPTPIHPSDEFSFVGVGTPGNSTPVAMPTGVQTGDLLILIIGNKGTGHTWSATGWTTQASQASSDTFDLLQLFTRIADGTEGSSIAISGDSFNGAAILAYRAPLVETPDDVDTAEGATAPSLTPSLSNDLVLYVQGATTNVSPAAPSGMTARVNVFLGSIYHLYLADRLAWPTTSATGTITTTSGASAVVIDALFKVNLNIGAPFIASITTVYAPTLPVQVSVPFIASNTVVYTPDLPEVHASFIGTNTHVWEIFSQFDPNLIFGGPGNGGESFLIRLNANSVTDTATLTTDITATSTVLVVTGDTAFPTSKPFVVTIDDEVILIYQTAPGSYHVRLRGLSNTPAASHTAGADVSWGDSYDQAITATGDIAHSFTADITSSGSFTYLGWLMCFDSSQAYLGTDRYPMHVTQVLGVFDTGTGSTGSNRCDAAQPNAICTPTGISDDCPAALSNPSLITSDILTGDVAVIRYTNPETTVLDLGPRAAALQSWFGMMRVDDTDNDVTLTDPNGNVIDTTDGEGTYTGSVNHEWGNPVPLLPGIAPDASDIAGAAVTTPNDVPWTTVTLPGTDRYFTRGSGSGGYDEKGWPICCIAVRQGPKRIPHWQSWDWHDYNYVYTGFGTDAVFAQLLINRNGIVFGSLPSIDLPGPQDIDGPDVVWDDPNYFIGASWYVALYNGPYLVQGPSIGGTVTGTIGPGGTGYTPGVTFPGGASGPPSVTGSPPIEGGDGGDISPSLAGLHVWQTS